MMHAARIDNSPRLRRVLAALSDGREHTTRDLMAAADVCAVNSCIAELRANGVAVDCRLECRDGRRIYHYRLAGGAG